MQFSHSGFSLCFASFHFVSFRESTLITVLRISFALFFGKIYALHSMKIMFQIQWIFYAFVCIQKTTSISRGGMLIRMHLGDAYHELICTFPARNNQTRRGIPVKKHRFLFFLQFYTLITQLIFFSLTNFRIIKPVLKSQSDHFQHEIPSETKF